jgi:hypothetical protein
VDHTIAAENAAKHGILLPFPGNLWGDSRRIRKTGLRMESFVLHGTRTIDKLVNFNYIPKWNGELHHNCHQEIANPEEELSPNRCMPELAMISHRA